MRKSWRTNKGLWARVVIVLVGLVGLSTLSFNCAGNRFEAAKVGLASGSSDASSTSVASVAPGEFSATNSPYALMTGEQTFNSMLNVTGQSSGVTATQKTEYGLRTGALSDNSSLTGVNAPLMMAATSLAGEVCNGLVTKEKAAATRTFFVGVDFTKPISGNSPDAYTASAQAMASAFYGRSLSADERTILTDYYAEFVQGLSATQATQAAQTIALYTSLCAGMLSSFDAMVY